MHRPTPALIFAATGLAIFFMLWMVTAVAAVSTESVHNYETAQPTQQAARAVQSGNTTQPRKAAPVRTATPRTNLAGAEVVALQPTAQAGSSNGQEVQSVAPVFVTPTKAPYLNDLGQFVEHVADGQAGVLRGVFAAGLFALPVVQQPDGNNDWVSEQDNEVTLFRAALQNGTIGLLAHNTRAGRDFGTIQNGQTITLVYGDRTTRSYKIIQQLGFQALEPLNTSGDFIDLANNQRITTGDVFNRFFKGTYPLVLQTCIERNGDASWGRLFLMAEPIAGTSN